MQGAWVWSLVQELDPTCHSSESIYHNGDRRSHVLQLRPSQPNKKIFFKKEKTNGYIFSELILAWFIILFVSIQDNAKWYSEIALHITSDKDVIPLGNQKHIIDKENKLVVTAGDSTRGRGEIGDGN